MKAAFFDLDRTLIPVNSARLFARSERAEGRLSLAGMVRAGWWLGLYHFGLADMERAYDAATAKYAGEHEDTLRDITARFFARDIQPLLLPAARAAMDEHRAAGDLLVLHTASSCYMAAEATAAWGFDAWLANRFHVDDAGHLDGRIQRPLCYGPGKATHARAFASEHGIDLSKSAFYSDSISDVPMFELVGQPVVVNPDPRLAKEAVRRGWPVEHWTAS